MFGDIGKALGISGGDVFKGLTGIVGSVLGGAADISGQRSANQANMDMMNQANAFSAQQFATRYQTTVKDLEAAGLNPMLAYGQGGGSPPSAVGIATQTNPYQRAGDYAQKALGAANTAMQTQLTDAQITESISRTGVNDEQRKLLNAETLLKILEAPNVSQRTKNLAEEELLLRARRTATNAQEAAIRQEMQIRKPEAGKSGTWWGMNVSPYIKDFTGGASGAANMKFLLK